MPKKQKAEALARLGEVLDFESYQWLMQQHPNIAKALEAAVMAGASKDDIRRLSWVRTQRPEIVQRLVNATRYLELFPEDD